MSRYYREQENLKKLRQFVDKYARNFHADIIFDILKPVAESVPYLDRRKLKALVRIYGEGIVAPDKVIEVLDWAGIKSKRVKARVRKDLIRALYREPSLVYHALSHSISTEHILDMALKRGDFSLGITKKGFPKENIHYGLLDRLFDKKSVDVNRLRKAMKDGAVEFEYNPNDELAKKIDRWLSYPIKENVRKTLGVYAKYHGRDKIPTTRPVIEKKPYRFVERRDVTGALEEVFRNNKINQGIEHVGRLSGIDPEQIAKTMNLEQMPEDVAEKYPEAAGLWWKNKRLIQIRRGYESGYLGTEILAHELLHEIVSSNEQAGKAIRRLGAEVIKAYEDGVLPDELAGKVGYILNKYRPEAHEEEVGIKVLSPEHDYILLDARSFKDEPLSIRKRLSKLRAHIIRTIGVIKRAVSKYKTSVFDPFGKVSPTLLGALAGAGALGSIAAKIAGKVLTADDYLGILFPEELNKEEVFVGKPDIEYGKIPEKGALSR